MSVGIIKIEFSILGVQSLKEKRSVLQPFINKIRNNYNVSVSELDGDEDVAHSTIGFAHIANSSKLNHKKLSQVLAEAERVRDLNVDSYSTEVM